MVGCETIIIVTCRGGRIEWCREELGNTFYTYDPGIRIEATRHRGVLLARTSLCYGDVVRLLYSTEYGFVEKAVPLEVIVGASAEAVAGAVLRLAEKHGLRETCLRVRIRGVRGLSMDIYHRASTGLADAGIRVADRAEKCVYVEGVDDVVGVSVLPRVPPGRRMTLFLLQDKQGGEHQGQR